MFNRSVFCIFALMLIFQIGDFTNAKYVQLSELCDRRFKCSNVEDVVWATDDRNCFVYRNECQFNNFNCYRITNNETELNIVSKEKCQELCSPICTDDYRPVCAEYNGVKRIFANRCMYENHICQSGETYSLAIEGECAKE